MATTTALPLTQQALAWSLQALGLSGPDQASGLVSNSTIKNARRGEPILQSWDRLLEHFMSVQGVELQPMQREQIAAALHEMDARLSTLDRCGLSLRERLPPVIGLLAPHLGVRLGALAALADLDLPSDPDSGRALSPIGEALTDPLSPRFFGRVVDYFLRRHHPEWKTQDQQAWELERRGVVARKTFERWRSTQVEVPNVVSLSALARVLGEEDEQRRALASLRLARLFVVLRQDLAEWGDEALAEEAAKAVATWARVTRATLVRPEAPLELAELLALMLESPNGDAILGSLRSRLPGSGLEEVPPGDAAALLRASAGRAAQCGDSSELRWLLRDQVLAPMPLILVPVGARLVGGDFLFTLAANPLDIIQGAWFLTAVLRGIMLGEEVEVCPPGASKAVPVVPDESLQKLAGDLLSQTQRVVNDVGDEPLSDVAGVQFIFALFNAAGVPWDPRGVVDPWNEAMRMLSMPTKMEPLATDEQVRAAPHLAPRRAQRLAKEGQTSAALEWLGWWKKQPREKSWEERAAAADVLVCCAHRQLDKLAPVRRSALQVRAIKSTVLPKSTQELVGAMEAMEAMEANVNGVTQKTQRIGQQLLASAGTLLSDPPDAGGALLRVTLFLPLVIRLASLAGELTRGGGEHLQLARGLAQQLEEGLQLLPSHGDAWATLAVWQELQGIESLAVKQAKHYGAGQTYQDLRDRFEGDGMFAQK